MMEDAMKKIGMVAVVLVLSVVLFIGGSFLGLWGHSFSNYLDGDITRLMKRHDMKQLKRLKIPPEA